MDRTSETDGAGAAPESDEISREELHRRLRDSSLVVVDVLSKDIYDSGHIPSAINLPLDEITTHAAEALPNRAAEIAVYCGAFT
jgi:rhodanese-related sulfurtransferase